MKKTYRQPSMIKVVAWIFLALTTPIFVILFYEFSQGRVEDKSAIILIPLLFMPFYIGALWILWHFRGKFILTREGISLSQFGKETFLRYQDIYTIEERDSQFIPYLLLVAPEASLKISFKTDSFSNLYATLRQYISPMEIAERTSLPLALRFRAEYLRESLIWFSVYAIFTGILSTGITHNKPWPILYWLGMWGVFITIALFLLALNEWASPYQVSFASNQIEAKYLFRKMRTFSTQAILRIERERQVRRIRYGMTMVVHPIVITFENGERFQLEEGRIWSFGYSPDRLLAILTHQLSRKT